MNRQAEYYQGADGMSYRVWRTGPGDKTQLHSTYPTGYDSRCSHCWLNTAHSEAAHIAQIQEQR